MEAAEKECSFELRAVRSHDVDFQTCSQLLTMQFWALHVLAVLVATGEA